MDAKKIRNAGVVSVLSLALLLGAGIASSMSAGAQNQTYVGNNKPDPMHPAITSVSSNSITLAIAPNTNREVLIDASTVVVKDGRFEGVTALQVGDKVQVDPRITLPSGLGGSNGDSAAQAASSQANPANTDKSQLGGSDGSSAQPTGGEGSGSHSAPVAPLDPKNKNNGAPPSSTGASQGGGDGGAAGVPSAATVIWVTSNDDQLLGGVVHWSQDGTAILNIPKVGYSEFVIHTSNSTGYQKMASPGTAPEAANASDMAVGASVVVLGSDGGPGNAGYFTAKAILVLPASGKLR